MQRRFSIAHGRVWRLAIVLTGIAALAAACAPTPQRNSSEGAASEAQQPKVTKTLRLGVTQEPKEGIGLFASNGGNGTNVTFTFHGGLTVYDQQGSVLPNIARKVPSIADGDWKVLPDGRMEVTWSLRPDVRWHDGTPLTADDFVFGLTVQQDPETPARANAGVGLISEAVATDPHTLLLRWKQTYADANASGPTDIVAIPRHLMADAYQGNKQLFYNNTYWTTEFVGLGPYRIADWVSGSYIEAAAFDQYFLGRPKIDRLIIRYFSDVKTLVASLLAGDTDVAGVASVGIVEGASLRQQWADGDILPALTSFRVGATQFRDPNLPWVRDLRVRQALSHMTDRQAIVDSLTYGLSMIADTAIAPDDPAFRQLEERGLTRYPYDLTRADRLLSDAGWRRGSDGVYQNSNGEPLAITIASPARQDINVQEVTAIASEWKTAGLAATPDAIPYNSVNLNELKTTVHGVFLGSNDLIPTTHFSSFTTAQMSSAANRFAGANKGGYSNPAYDRLYDEFSTTLDPTKRRSAVVEMAKMGADEAIWMPFYYGSDIASVRKGVRGVGTVPAVQGATTWNIHTWEVD